MNVVKGIEKILLEPIMVLVGFIFIDAMMVVLNLDVFDYIQYLVIYSMVVFLLAMKKVYTENKNNKKTDSFS